MIRRLPLLGRHQIHALRLLVQRLGELTVDLKLGGDVRRQVFTVLRQQFGTLQRLFRLPLALAVLQIAQRLQIGIQLLALLLRQFRTGARQLLAVIGGELGEVEFIHQRLQARRFRLQGKILRLGESIVAGLRADAALNLIELTTGIGLLLRQLVQGVGDFTRAILLLLRLAARFQQLAADLQDLLVQRIGGQAGWHLARLFAQIIELGTQALKQFGEIVDNVLILTGALEG